MKLPQNRREISRLFPITRSSSQKIVSFQHTAIFFLLVINFLSKDFNPTFGKVEKVSWFGRRTTEFNFWFGSQTTVLNIGSGSRTIAVTSWRSDSSNVSLVVLDNLLIILSKPLF